MIRVGIGGWTYEPWRGTFYPANLKQADELDYASRHLTTIEINGTFYRAQSAASFGKWRDATPNGFIFSVNYPAMADETADFVYARLQGTKEENETGYAAADLDRWAARARLWESGGTPGDLAPASKLFPVWPLLEKLGDLGRAAARAWLDLNVGALGTRSTVDLAARFD